MVVPAYHPATLREKIAGWWATLTTKGKVALVATVSAGAMFVGVVMFWAHTTTTTVEGIKSARELKEMVEDKAGKDMADNASITYTDKARASIDALDAAFAKIPISVNDLNKAHGDKFKLYRMIGARQVAAAKMLSEDRVLLAHARTVVQELEVAASCLSRGCNAVELHANFDVSMCWNNRVLRHWVEQERVGMKTYGDQFINFVDRTNCEVPLYGPAPTPSA